MSKKRRIIYVDATVKDTMTKISLYDPQNNKTDILELIDICSSHKAEQYAILYAILYVIKNNYPNSHILCDNLPATQNKKIVLFCQENGIGISWIPREINTIADKTADREATVKIKEWYMLKIFYKLILDK